MIILFSITFSMLIIVEQIRELRTPAEKFDLFVSDKAMEFFSKDFSDLNTILILGSSHVARLNATLISEIVNNEISNNIITYNLAIDGTNPYEEINYLDDIININPELVMIGISYRDFGFPFNDETNSELFLDVRFALNEFFSKISKNLIPDNPQFITRNIIKNMIDVTEKQSIPKERCEERFFVSDTPFSYYCKESTIIYNEKLPHQISEPSGWNDPNDPKKNISALYTIIEKLNEANIPIIILTTPLHQRYHDSLSEDQKRNFELLLKNIEKNKNTKIFHFNSKYVHLNIWEDLSHVTTNQTVTVFNEDVARIIIQELRK